MSAIPGFKVTSTTTGTPAPGYEHLSGGYHYQRDPTWTPNDPRYREDTQGAARKANAARIAGREARKRKFAEHRAADVPVLEAGRRVGVTDKTAHVYERERLAALGEAQQP